MLRPQFTAVSLRKPFGASRKTGSPLAPSRRFFPLLAGASLSALSANIGVGDAQAGQLSAPDALPVAAPVLAQSKMAKPGIIALSASAQPQIRVAAPPLVEKMPVKTVSAKTVSAKTTSLETTRIAATPLTETPSVETRANAQITPSETGPAATPTTPADEANAQLSVPVGPEQPPAQAPNAPPVEAPETPPVPATPAPPAITNTGPRLAPIIGDARAAEGREITDVRVVGNRVIPLATIQAQIRTARGSAFSARQVEFDQGRIAQIGFFASVQAQVTPDLSDPNKVTLTFIVVENRVVRAVQFAGNTALDAAELSKSVKTQPDRILNFNTIAEDIEAINKAYRDKGFIALVRSAGQTDDGALVFDLLEARVSRIEVKGLKKTRESLVRRQIRTQTGELFNEKNLQRDRNRLFDMNFFQAPPDVDVQNDPQRPGYVVITLSFVERPTGQFSIGVGFDSRSKISGFLTLQESNFRGTGRRAIASIETGSRRNFEFGFGNPFIGEKNASYDVSIYKRTLFRDIRLFRKLGADNLNDVTYEEERTGGRFSFTRPLDFDRRRTLVFGYRNESAQATARNRDGDETPVTIGGEPLDSDGRISAFSLGYLLDSRDLRIDPSTGSRFSFTVEKAVKLLGDTDFTKLDTDIRRYIPLGSAKVKTGQPQLVLAGRFVGGKSINQLPAFEQYYIGGSDTVRGYDSGQQFGDNQFYGNLELRYRLQNRFQIVGFVDAGTAYGGRFSSGDSADLLFGYGIGARIQSPIGPIRLDIGRGDDGVRTHFAIGPTF